jgi:hypothetical protein
MKGMERHIELAQLLADLNRKIAEVKAVANSVDDAAEKSRSEQILAELYQRCHDAKQELRDVAISHAEQWRNEQKKKRKREPPQLTAGTIARLELLFKSDDQSKAREVLQTLSDQRLYDRPAEAERVWIAALKLSCGSLAELTKAVELANLDYRDLLLSASFANDPKEHLRWWPGQPAPWYARRLPPPNPS